MGRGGRRKGAGRKRAFTEQEELQIGDCCEFLYERYEDQGVEREMDKRCPETAKHRRWVWSVPVEQRREFLKNNEAKIWENFDEAARTDNQTDPDDYVDKDGLYFVGERRKPQGVRDRIKKIVQRELCMNYGISVSTYKIDKCWQKFRWMFSKNELD